MAYMLRLHEIETRIPSGEERLRDAWRALADDCDGDTAHFSREWRSAAEEWPLVEINELIDRHNRWYPAESRLPMDPRTGDYALVNGHDYRLKPLDGEWVLARFPPELTLAAASTCLAPQPGAGRMAT